MQFTFNQPSGVALKQISPIIQVYRLICLEYLPCCVKYWKARIRDSEQLATAEYKICEIIRQNYSFFR